MVRSDVRWVSCPVCDAGSPAGVSVCPRCRYEFRVLGGRRSAEFQPAPPVRRPGRPLWADGQFTLALGLLVIAAFAVVFAWPVLLVPVGAAVAGWLLHRRGYSFRWHSVVGICAVAAVVGFLMGLVLSR